MSFGVFNAYDLMVGVFLLFGMIWGGYRGALRQISGLVGAWLALVITLWLYPWFSRQILQGFFTEASPAIMDTFAFVILLIIINGIIQLILIMTSQVPEEKTVKQGTDINERMEDVDKFSISSPLGILGGMFMGLVATFIWLSILTVVANYAVTVGARVSPVAANFSAFINGAFITPYFYELMRLIYLSVSWFTPGGLPAIFSGIF